MFKKLFFNLINSSNGLKYVFKEHSFIAELLLGVILIPYIFFLETSILFKLLIFTVYILLLTFEIVNTTIEKLCDKITKDIDEDIKIIKDLASASVFVILLLLIILVIFTFFI
jgi:diacylglycerol kinase (ATP)